MQEEVWGGAANSGRKSREMPDQGVDPLEPTFWNLLRRSGLETKMRTGPAKPTAVAKGDSMSGGEVSARADDGSSPPDDPSLIVE